MKRKLIAVLLFLAVVLSFASCSLAEGWDYSVSEYRTTMEYHEDFKILQLTDLHLGIESDLKLQLEVVENSILEEKPDLVILTGDSFMFSNKSIVRALMETLNSACDTVTRERGRLTKFTITFGNHDNQGDYSRYFVNEAIMEYVAEDGEEINDGLYAAFRDFADDNLFGNANFYIDLVDDRTKPEDEVDVKYRIHIIDSNTYHSLGLKYGYDVIHEDQLQHTQKIYNTATADKDYIGLAFLHIPFYEFDEIRTAFLNLDDKSAIGFGEFNEPISYPYENNGSYDMLRAANISAFFVGHDHVNYGDFIYTPLSSSRVDKAIFSYGVKTTNQLYHERDMMGYKTITLRDISEDEFVSIENIKENFKNVLGGYKSYENK